MLALEAEAREVKADGAEEVTTTFLIGGCVGDGGKKRGRQCGGRCGGSGARSRRRFERGRQAGNGRASIKGGEGGQGWLAVEEG